jgi:hypothetical protein
MHRRPLLLIAALAASAGLAACGNALAEDDPPDPPAHLVQIKGTTRNAVVLTEEAARRVGIATEPATGSPQRVVIPVAALVYDKDGGTWTYVVTAPLTYERQSVALLEIAGDQAILKSGPAPGARVVTVGAAELLGTEYGVAGG